MCSKRGIPKDLGDKHKTRVKFMEIIVRGGRGTAMKYVCYCNSYRYIYACICYEVSIILRKTVVISVLPVPCLRSKCPLASSPGSYVALGCCDCTPLCPSLSGLPLGLGSWAPEGDCGAGGGREALPVFVSVTEQHSFTPAGSSLQGQQLIPDDSSFLSF